MIKIRNREKMQMKGELFLKEGRAYNITKDDWKFETSKEIGLGNNVLCDAGIRFVLSRNWGLPAAIAVGNGATTGSDTPIGSDTSLKSEISQARFAVRGDQYSRVNDGVITLSALWARGQLGSTPITEWGLFFGEIGTPVIGTNTGFLIARRAQAYQKLDLDKDVEIVWVITITWS